MHLHATALLKGSDGVEDVEEENEEVEEDEDEDENVQRGDQDSEDGCLRLRVASSSNRYNMGGDDEKKTKRQKKKKQETWTFFVVFYIPYTRRHHYGSEIETTHLPSRPSFLPHQALNLFFSPHSSQQFSMHKECPNRLQNPQAYSTSEHKSSSSHEQHGTQAFGFRMQSRCFLFRLIISFLLFDLDS